MYITHTPQSMQCLCAYKVLPNTNNKLAGILESLKFSEMSLRYETIQDAYRGTVNPAQSTFDWIFDDRTSSFVRWMKSDDGLFWVNGKAGSGKSTLMKFIVEDPRLKTYTEDSRFSSSMVANFFFWAAGTVEQKSQRGLFMTILYSLLSHETSLIRTLFEDHWMPLYENAAEMRPKEHAREIQRRQRLAGRNSLAGMANIDINRNINRKVSEKLIVWAELEWSRSDLFRLVAHALKQLTQRKICLFIDGLDEYDGTEEELDELTCLIKQWALLPHLKVCVSTRPWPVFEANFGNGQVPGLKLQDLTSGDIAFFVSDSFMNLPLMKALRQANPEGMPDFYSSIVKKAEGVFLWVRLVVRSLIGGLRNGDEMSVLRQRIDELPPDLKSLYRHLLQRIPERYWIASSRLFRIVQSAKSPRADLLWYAGERAYDPLETRLSDETRIARCYQVHLRLMSQCAGLLEARTGGHMRLGGAAPNDEDDTNLLRPNEHWSFSSQQHYINSTVHFIHRTTSEFLSSEDVSDLLKTRLSGSAFDSNAWLATHAFLAVHEVRTRVDQRGRSITAFFRPELGEKSKLFRQYLAQCDDQEISRLLQDCEDMDRDDIQAHYHIKIGRDLKENSFMVDEMDMLTDDSDFESHSVSLSPSGDMKSLSHPLLVTNSQDNVRQKSSNNFSHQEDLRRAVREVLQRIDSLE